jgi:hypothetical protein
LGTKSGPIAGTTKQHSGAHHCHAAACTNPVLLARPQSASTVCAKTHTEVTCFEPFFCHKHPLPL